MGAASVRMFLALAVLIYLLLSQYYQAQLPDKQRMIVYMAMMYFSYSLLLWLSNLRWPGPNILRRVISILADTGILTFALITAGETAAPFFGGYLWVTIANGLRYGRSYLYATNLISIFGFALVLVLSSYWQNQMVLGVGLMVWLILLPGYVAVLLRRLEDALHKANLANSAKNQFLSNMSHELRTPLNVIMGYSDILQEDAVAVGNRQMAEDLSKVQSSASHLLGLINGILDLSRIESGWIGISSECFDVRLFFEDILSSMQPMFEQRGNLCGIKFNLEQYLIDTDKAKLKQVIINLLDNANKFTEGGLIQVEVNDVPGICDKPILTIHVQDNGIGIPQDRVAHIFEPFSQVDTSSTRKYEGAGLGLAIAQRFAEALAGNISVISQEGEGSKFSLSIPHGQALCPIYSDNAIKLE